MNEKARKNPLRLLDNKADEARTLAASAPSILDYLEEEGKERFAWLQQALTDGDVLFQVNPRIVRGLDYYTDTVFEIENPNLGSQATILAGGRYDGLSKSMGGHAIPAVGFGSGVERLIMSLDGLRWPLNLDCFVVYSPEAAETVFKIMRSLRESGISVSCDLDGASFKSQMRQADKSGARAVLLLGEDELKWKSVSLRNMADSEQQLIRQADLLERVQKVLA
jgi:histidyl-tRNA synthetase